MSDTIATVLGQAGERLVTTTGWVGEHPGDGDSVAHLLVHPTGHGAAEKMRRLAGMLGLARADTNPDQPVDVPPDTTWATITNTGAGETLWLHYGHEAWIQRPVDPDWTTPARARRYIVLTLGTDPLHTIRDVDAYLARSHRIHLGIIRLA